jgi:hypothetical protein
MTLNQSLSLAFIFALLAFLAFAFSPTLIFGFKVVSITWALTALHLGIEIELSRWPDMFSTEGMR